MQPTKVKRQECRAVLAEIPRDALVVVEALHAMGEAGVIIAKTLHDFLVAEGHIAANDTTPITYPRVAETVTVTSFKKYNNTAVDIGVVSTKPGQTRVVRILNGAAYLLTEHVDGSTTRADLCAGTVSCAAFTVETGIADAFIEQANGNLTAIGVEQGVPQGGHQRLLLGDAFEGLLGGACRDGERGAQ